MQNQAHLTTYKIKIAQLHTILKSTTMRNNAALTMYTATMIKLHIYIYIYIYIRHESLITLKLAQILVWGAAKKRYLTETAISRKQVIFYYKTFQSYSKGWTTLILQTWCCGIMAQHLTWVILREFDSQPEQCSVKTLVKTLAPHCLWNQVSK